MRDGGGRGNGSGLLIIRLFGIAAIVAAAAIGSAAVAQTPISPIYRTSPEQQQTRGQGGASGEGPCAGGYRRARKARTHRARNPKPPNRSRSPTAPIPPPLQPDAGESAAADTRSRAVPSPPEPSPQETTRKGQASTTTAATPPPRPSAPAPVSSESEAKQHPGGDAGNSADVITGDENREVGGRVPKRDEKGQGPIRAAAGLDRTPRKPAAVPSIIPGLTTPVRSARIPTGPAGTAADYTARRRIRPKAPERGADLRVGLVLQPGL